jgi:hypothetical protein
MAHWARFLDGDREEVEIDEHYSKVMLAMAAIGMYTFTISHTSLFP